MDRLSERDADTRRRMFELCSLAPLVLVTSRNQEPDCGRSIRFEPSYLASASSLSRFIEFEVAQHIALDGLSEILTPVNIAAELLRLLERGRTGRKITPLLASTFVAIACDILRQEDEIDRLPRSVVRIYIEFIRSLHARGRVCFDGVGEREYMLMSSRLAAQCMLNGAGPASLARDAVSDIIAKSIPQHDSASVLNCLISIGLLHQFNRAGSLRVAFSIDSYAEVLAAWHIARGDEVRLAPVLQELKLPADMQGSAQEVLSYLEELRAEPSPQREAIVL